MKNPTPMNRSNKRRHFPIVWRAAALLLIGLTVAIAGAVLITRATRTGTDCLLVNGDPETELWDLHTGLHNRIPVPTFPPGQNQYNTPILSPNRLHSMDFAQNGSMTAKTFLTPVLSSQTYHYLRWGVADDSW